MLEEEHPDAVSIVVPTPFHYQVAAAAMGTGHTLLARKTDC